MEANIGMGGGMFSGINSVMLGLELSPQANSRKANQSHQNILSFGQNEVNQQSSVKQGYQLNSAAKSQTQHLTFSDDDTAEDNCVGKKNIVVSPWQRMKWTDSVVKLLIAVVFYVEDDHEAVSEGKKNKLGVHGSGALQKKGKWKSVSKAMIERGFFVSPQQCEDKFNDLNKRYKRVNDILGKGTSCKVVEDQSLLETLDYLSPRMKVEVKKLLDSKHLFFREMCAYHNSCGGSAQHSAEVVGESSKIQQQKKCSHSSENSPNVPDLGRPETEYSKYEDDDDNDDDDDDDDEDDDDNEVEDGARGHDKESDGDVKTTHKRTRNEMYLSSSKSPLVKAFSNELNYVVQNETMSSGEKRQWMRNRLMHLEEQGMNYQREAYELEKQKMEWMKLRSRKERDMEAEKLANEKARLENERLVLVIKQTEVELLDFQQQSISSNRKNDPSSITR